MLLRNILFFIIFFIFTSPSIAAPPGLQKKGINNVPSFLGTTPPGWNQGLKKGWDKDKNWKWNKNKKLWENKNWEWNNHSKSWQIKRNGNINPIGLIQ